VEGYHLALLRRCKLEKSRLLKSLPNDVLLNVGPGESDVPAGFWANKLFNVIVNGRLDDRMEITFALDDGRVRPNMNGDLILAVHSLRAGIHPRRRLGYQHSASEGTHDKQNPEVNSQHHDGVSYG